MLWPRDDCLRTPFFLLIPYEIDSVGLKLLALVHVMHGLRAVAHACALKLNQVLNLVLPIVQGVEIRVPNYANVRL